MCAALLALLSVAVGCTHAAITADLITSLPGWEGALPSAQYSGLPPCAVAPRV
jgi:hypothetical protein